MKTWDDWSDFDLSLAVAKINYPETASIWVGRVAVSFSDASAGGFDVRYFDINSWADMGPIIVDSGISLIKLIDGYQAISNSWDYIDITDRDGINDCCIGNEAAMYGHKNPLRAAAIAFLMMNGVNP